MNSATPAIQNLARRLIACERAHNPRADAVQACDKLRKPLAKLAGAAGFRTLLARALALAKADEPWLQTVQVLADGTLDGFAEARRLPGDKPPCEAGTVILARLLGLLVTFIGEPLTMRLVRDVWPEMALEKTTSDEGQP